jgi:carbon monoxide dehydrogenase subunit G
MKLAGSYKLDLPREQVYQLLQDPSVLAQCMPGCDRLERTGENEYAMRMKLLVASMSGLFEGKVTLTDQKPPESFRLKVEGNGKIGWTRGEGLLTLSPDGAGTTVSYEGEVSIGGPVAAIGQRLLDSTARMMIKRFFDKLNEVAQAQSSSA